MAITAGETLSLNALGSATGQTTKSLSAAKGNTTGPIAMSSFGIDEVGDVTGYTYAVEGTNETYTLDFTGSGDNFSRISSRSENTTWEVVFGSTISLTTNNGGSAVFTIGDMSNTDGVLNSIIANSIQAIFVDGFNDHAAGYGDGKPKTVYSVDSYDGNSTALCLTTDTAVTLSDGTTIEIGDIEEGMKLRGYILGGVKPADEEHILDWTSDNLESFETEVTVMDVVFSFSENVYNINDRQITATGEHPFVVQQLDGSYKFKTVHTLEVGESLVKGDGEHVEITSIEIEYGTREIVSIDVDGSDTYLANGYITHNKGGDAHTDLGTPGAPTSLTYTNVDGENKNITWATGTSSGDTGVTAYDVQVDNNSDFSSPVLDFTEYNSTTLNVVALASGTYYVRVRAIDHGLKSTYSSTSFAHTQGIGQ